MAGKEAMATTEEVHNLSDFVLSLTAQSRSAVVVVVAAAAAAVGVGFVG